jgi:hypothetical protein
VIIIDNYLFEYKSMTIFNTAAIFTEHPTCPLYLCFDHEMMRRDDAEMQASGSWEKAFGCPAVKSRRRPKKVMKDLHQTLSWLEGVGEPRETLPIWPYGAMALYRSHVKRRCRHWSVGQELDFEMGVLCPNQKVNQSRYDWAKGIP